MLTEEYQQSFQAINPTLHGLEPLRALTAIQNLGLSHLHIKNAPPNFDPLGSMKNYLSDCFIGYKNLQTDPYTIDSAYKAAFMNEGWDAVKVPINTLTTSISLGVTYHRVGCKDAHAQIKSSWFGSQLYKDTIEDYLTSKGSYGDKLLEGYNNTLTANSPAAAAANQYIISEAILVSNMLQNAANSEGGSIYRNEDVRKFEAKQERLFKMASERSMWMEMSIGMVSILESFVFFIAPLVAVLLVMGGMGLKALISYFGLVVWVNFWPITMMFVNLYTMMSLEGKFTGLGGGASTFGLFDENMMTVESSIAFASQLTAMIPMLTLFILHRGVHTMMGVASQSAPNTFKGAAAAQSAQTTGEAGKYDYKNQSSMVTGSYGTGYNIQQSSQSGTNPGFRNMSSHIKSSLEQDSSGRTLAHNTNQTIAQGAMMAKGANEIEGVSESDIQAATYSLSAEGKLGVKGKAGSASAGAGFSYSDMVNQLSKQGVDVSSQAQRQLKESFDQTKSVIEGWSKTDSYTTNDQTADAYSELQASTQTYTDSLSDKNGAVINSTRQSVMGSTVDLEQSAAAAAIGNDKDKAHKVLTSAVNSMSDDTVNHLLTELRDPSEGELSETKAERRTELTKKLFADQQSTFTGLSSDKNTAGRNDREGLAVMQTPIKLLADMQQKYTSVDGNSSFVEQNTSKMKEQALELKAMGELYKGMGVELKNENLIAVGETQINNANRMLDQINDTTKTQLATNDTGIALGANLHESGATKIDRNVTSTKADKNANIVTSKEKNNMEVQSSKGEGTLGAAQENITENEKKIASYIEKLNEKANVASGVFNQLDGHFENAAGAAAHIVDALGGNAGYEERIAQVGVLKNGAYSETMGRGFELLAENGIDNVNKILNDGFNDGATKEQREDAEAIVYATSDEGRAIFNLTNDLYQSSFRDEDGAKFIGDGVSTKNWNTINNNLNRLSDNDANLDGKIDRTERGTLSTILHSNDGKNVIPAMARAEFFGDGQAGNGAERAVTAFTADFDGKTPSLWMDFSETTSMSDKVRSKEIMIANNAGVDYTPVERPVYSEGSQGAQCNDRAAVSHITKDQISGDKFTQQFLSQSLGFRHGGNPSMPSNDHRVDSPSSTFKGTPDQARTTMTELTKAQTIAQDKGYEREAANIRRGVDDIRKQIFPDEVKK